MSELKTTELPLSSAERKPGDPGALGEFLGNLLGFPRIFRNSVVRHGAPTSDRAKSESVMSNFFLHVLAVRIHTHSLKLTTTLGLGIVTLALFVLLTFTGILLMVYYKPSVDQAYDSMKDIMFVVPTGRFIRNIHRWSAHAMVACVILHMARVFYTASYKKPREFNWILGMILFVLTLALSFTGYLLPWDQLAFWAITIGANIAQSPREITDALGITQFFDPGEMQKELLLGAHYVGQEALTRFYVLHVMVLPLLATIAIAVHMWRLRKDGGLTRPSSADETTEGESTSTLERSRGFNLTPPMGMNPLLREKSREDRERAPLKTWGLMAVVKGKTPAVDKELTNTVPAYPHALYAIAALTMLTTAVMLLLGYLYDAPLKEMANPAVPENPAKAPWYFLGLQEMVGYSAFMGGVGIPSLVILGLALIPYLDREREDSGVWFSGTSGRRVALVSFLYGLAVTVGILVFTVRYGWLREWYPAIPQLVITAINPGTVIVLAFAVWSILTVVYTRSTRMGAIALFTCFLISFAILTYFATVHRGPNWDFYWLPSQWPTH